MEGASMIANADTSGLSQLEREFELELEDAVDSRELDQEFESQDQEADDAELEFERGGSDYAERLSELAAREFETESEVDQALNEVLNDMEQEYFFGSLKKAFNKFKKGTIGKLVSKGLKMAAGHIPAFQALKGITSLARGDLKGMVGSLAKAGLGSVVPGGGAALGALGFEAETSTDREAWDNVVNVARESYEHLARNLNERVNEPLEASRLAADAFKAGLAKVGRAGSPSGGARRRHRIRVRRGDVLIIECE
jgi:hypothetical protein